MAIRRWQVRFAVILMVLGTTAVSASSQDMPSRSTASVLRQQLGSIAEEVVGALRLAANSPVDVSVGASPVSGLAEDAFVEALQRAGYRAFIRSKKDTAGIDLIVNMMSGGAQYTQLSGGSYERTIQTELEARTQKETGEAVAVLGMYHRAFSDTVSQKDPEIALQRKSTVEDEDGTFFQRLVGPLVVLASGIMIVYLFFTVRS